jgi:hypothetical protein
MNKLSIRRAGIAGLLLPAMLMAGCAQTPMGPTVQVMPGPGKTLDTFAYDQATCKQFSQNAVAGQADSANNRGVGAAALTTVLGAGLGAAVGGGRGAAIGAAGGALGGTGIGASTSSNAQLSIQQQYDNAFSQCMYTKGNAVPGYGPMMMQPAAYAPAGPGMVRAVQVELNRLGYLQSTPDGTVGPRTSTAISQFQNATGQQVTGMPSPALLAQLQSTP